ncbi:efflux transporter periplasmic adaptor subunit [Metarhizobium album]|uniref:Efflux transporter periplasmic adaptor subunit n=1 Tax=Metarhizobium album TaxID=2182425 RepID=A0A2U2DJM2_9HYPH|nr:efflux RND transporter periplasmic adaptor subunit [Rhizobium album]PWE53517.1 efflux transporter periplasmic adaptor subunit [Rhizobium album]
MTSKKTRWALLGTGMGIVVSAIAAGTYLDLPGGAIAAQSGQAAQVPAIPVTVATVEPHNVSTWQEFSGRLEAVDRVEVRSRVAGAIQSVHFREGGLVRTGDLLITIDPAPYEAAVARAESQVASVQARLDLATAELARGKVLSSKSTISQSDFAQRQSAFSEATAARQAAVAALKVAQLDLGYTEIRAPIAGRVGKLEITVGNLVAAGSASPVLTTLVSIDPIYAGFSVNEELVAKTLAALPSPSGVPAIEAVPVEITTLAGKVAPIRGKLQLIDNEVDAASGTIRVRAVFDNPGGLLIPGQFVRIRLGEPNASERLTISERAIGTDQDKKFVFVVGADNTASYRQVELGAKVDDKRIVEKGLAAGDTIVVSGLQRIRSGAVVLPQAEGQVAQQ